MDDPFIRNYIEDLLKNIRTQVLLKLIKPYTRIRIPFISKVFIIFLKLYIHTQTYIHIYIHDTCVFQELNVPEADVEKKTSYLNKQNILIFENHRHFHKHLAGINFKQKAMQLHASTQT